MTESRILPAASGLRVPVAEPTGTARCTIYALHGGGLNGDYWDCPTDTDLSLVRLATSLGYRVAHPDRPGHRAGDARWPGGLSTEAEAAVHTETIRELWPDEPVVLLGQSAGAMVALHIAASASDGSLPQLLGIDYSGVGITLDVSRIVDGLTLESFWGPKSLYPPATFTPEGRVTAPTTEHDGTAANSWSQAFHSVAARVQIPVRVTMVDHEAWWGEVSSTLIDVAAGFTSAVSVQTNIEYAAGHNVSVGLSARSYHLGVLAFVEQCLRRAQLTQH
ncbi:MAG: alpha/beta hydrolase [Acidimicrobiia bacterium]